MSTQKTHIGARRAAAVRLTTGAVLIAGCCILAALPGGRRTDERTNPHTAYGQELDTTAKQRPADRNKNARAGNVSVDAYVSPKSEITTRRAGPGNLSTGFEPGEGFAPGPIFGQVGWGAFQVAPEGHIDTVNPAAGSQHLRISNDPAEPTGTNTGAFSPDLGPLATGPSTTSVDVAISATNGADYIVAGQSPSEGFLTWQVRFSFLGNILVVDDPNFDGAFEFVDTGVAWVVGPYKNLTVCDDPVAGTTDYFYDGALIYSQVTRLPGTRVEQVVLFSDNFHVADDGDFDNLSIQSGSTGVCAVGEPQVLINEMLYWPGQVGRETFGHEHEWVEIYNAGSGDGDLTGWTISNRFGGADIALPPWTLPAGAFLTIHQTSGVDDMDFADLDGHFYTGSDSEVFDDNEDECALYSGTPGEATIMDFIAWSNKGVYAPFTAHSYAVSSGIWTAGDYFDSLDIERADSLSRFFDGYDRDVSSDWQWIPWYVYAQNRAIQPENPIQDSPQHMALIGDTTPTFDWADFADADSYELQVDNNWQFSSPEIDVSGLLASQHTPASGLPEEVYYWRVRAVVDGSPTPWAAAWITAISTSAHARATRGGPRNAPHRYQRKETNLLCIWDDVNRNSRPGCPESGNCGWDKPHPAQPRTRANPGCRHGRNYCWAASTAMVNAAYGGNLQQDRVAYRNWNAKRPQPEGDLGHDRSATDPQVTGVVSWALNGAAINYMFLGAGNFTFAQLKGWVDQLGCYVAGVPGHCLVIDDYLDFQLGNTNVQVIYSQDPWVGPNQPSIFTLTLFGQPQNIARRFRNQFDAVWLQPAAGVTARMQEAAVSTDSDGDGIMDFDEGNPRAFQSNINITDTDKDQVPDKNDIRNYTFHDTYHPGHENDPLSFSDIDGDGLRSENDCDSDSWDRSIVPMPPGANGNDGDFDGGEDINGDGHNVVPAGNTGDPCQRETCMFDATDSCLTVHVDRVLKVYEVGDAVFIVDIHGFRETHTYHANSTYWYELGGGCPDKVNDTPLVHSGSFTTDGGGHANPALVHLCPAPGQYYLTVDVLSDFNYSEPDNTDPQTCWTCVLPPDPHATWSDGTPGLNQAAFCVGNCNPPIPADFFGPGSDPFVGTVALRGRPIDPVTTGNASTLVQRSGHPVLPSDPVGTEGTVTIEIVALSLVSTEPIVVTFNGGQTPELWDVAVDLSDTTAPAGQLNAIKTHANGGVFSSELHIQPRFTFTRVDDPNEVRVFDTGLEGIDPVQLQSGNTPFVHTVNPDLHLISPSNGTFVPGVEETVPGDPDSQQVVPAPQTDPVAGVIHTVCPPRPPDPHKTEPGLGISSTNFGNDVNPVIPADFFGPGSDPFTGDVAMEGEPLDPADPEISTLIVRQSDPIQPSDPIGTEGTVEVELVALSLKSIDPITVTFNGGQNPELWDVGVKLSDVPVPPGSLTATKTHANGGTFDMSLLVNTKLTFTNTGNPADVRVLDTALEGIEPIQLATTTPAHWVHVLDPALEGTIQAPFNGVFVPGVRETPGGSVRGASGSARAIDRSDLRRKVRTRQLAPVPPAVNKKGVVIPVRLDQSTPPPPNSNPPLISDACPADNVGMLTNGDTIVGSTIGSVDDFAAGCDSQTGGPDEIFEFSVDVCGVWTFDSCTVPACWDTTLEIREETGGGCPGDFVACDGDGCSVCQYESAVSAFFSTGTTYYLIVDGWSSFAYGDFTITASLTEPCCVSDAECDDGDACTDDFCDLAIGQCVNFPNFDVATQCCDPATGFLTPIDDGDVCTDNVCNADGSVSHIPVPDGTACDDGDPCTTNDVCVLGLCSGQDINGLPCTTDADCPPPGTCDDNGLCVCEGTPGQEVVPILLVDLIAQTRHTITPSPLPGLGLSPPILAPPPHDILKNRYISIDPRGAGGVNVGNDFDIKVTLTGSLVNGQQGNGPWWASPPDAECISVVVQTQPGVPTNWDACPTLHLTGCPIIPTSVYDIVAVSGGTDSVPPLAASTQAKPGSNWHGDCVGTFTGTEWTAPNGVTSIDDAVAAIKTFQNPSATPGCATPPCNATHTSVTDMEPNLTPGPQINLTVNIADVFSIIKGFQGFEYPGPDLTQCP